MAKVFIHINGQGKYFDKEVVESNKINVEVYDNQTKTRVSCGGYEFFVYGTYELDDVKIDYYL